MKQPIPVIWAGLLIPAAAFLVALVAVPTLSAGLWFAVAITLASVIAALLAMGKMRRHLTSLEQQNEKHHASERALGSEANISRNYQKLLGSLLPVWERQTGLAQSQIEQGMTDLAGRFSDIHQRLQTAISTTEETATGMSGNQGLTDVINGADSELNKIVMSLRSAIHGRDELLSEISKLSQITDELRAMGAEVAGIASQTNLLALNAAIEAARAGEQRRQRR